MSKRKERQKQFTAPGSFVAFSFAQDLVNSAFLLLQIAFNEDKGARSGKPGGHYSIHSPASIVLICTAFDQWLNQSALALDIRYEGLRELAAGEDTIAKYRHLAETIANHSVEPPMDLQMAWDVRNEIVHWLPRKAAATSYWPEWLDPLQRKGLVLSALLPDGTDATDLATKLHSYLLAQWVWQVLSTAVDNLLALFPPEDQIEKGLIDWSAGVFGLYRQFLRGSSE